MDLPGAVLDPDADAERVYRMLVGAMEDCVLLCAVYVLTCPKQRGRLASGITNLRYGQARRTPQPRARTGKKLMSGLRSPDSQPEPFPREDWTLALFAFHPRWR